MFRVSRVSRVSLVFSVLSTLTIFAAFLPSESLAQHAPIGKLKSQPKELGGFKAERVYAAGRPYISPRQVNRQVNRQVRGARQLARFNNYRGHYPRVYHYRPQAYYYGGYYYGRFSARPYRSPYRLYIGSGVGFIYNGPNFGISIH